MIAERRYPLVTEAMLAETAALLKARIPDESGRRRVRLERALIATRCAHELVRRCRITFSEHYAMFALDFVPQAPGTTPRASRATYGDTYERQPHRMAAR